MNGPGFLTRCNGVWFVPLTDALPPAGIDYRGQLRLIAGDGSTTNDELYICRLTAAGTYAWSLVVLT